MDHRIHKSDIGEVFERAGHRIPVEIKGDLEDAAMEFFLQGVNFGDSAEKEIQVRIFELELKEKLNPQSELYEGEIVLGLGFFVIGSFDPVHLLDYSGSIQYQRSGFRMDKVEEVVNRLFQNSLVYFDNWIKNQNLSNRALAKTFRLDIIEQKQESTDDKVYYEPERPLVWDDFKARPRPTSRNNATIFTSFSLEGVSLMDSGAVVQTLEINVYMLPMQSWVKTPSDYGLNHEQRHFDVVRIVADRLIYRLENTELNLDFYQAQINEAYLDSYREMNRLQELYETGTNHGLDQAGQTMWNGWIDEALDGSWERIEELLRR
ncbi:hypothetical protein GCM10009119_13160 [Algoriphagus jejuensis]|uniref:Uncharacterized protein n=2 Tax=Algoriphagus jejuensis TaxID=419934 RepID=A0ABN1MXZ3_9BACT